MPFVAKIKSTGERVSIIDHNEPRLSLKDVELVCQFDDCQMPLIVRNGTIVRAHFAHTQAFQCATKLKSHPESEEHRRGKASVAAWLKNHLKEQGYENIVIQLEVGVPKAGRVADIMVSFPGGMREAHEIQLSSITTNELEQLTIAYHNEGISVVWWIGEGYPADSKPNREWIMREFGECPIINFVFKRTGI